MNYSNHVKKIAELVEEALHNKTKLSRQLIGEYSAYSAFFDEQTVNITVFRKIFAYYGALSFENIEMIYEHSKHVPKLSLKELSLEIESKRIYFGNAELALAKDVVNELKTKYSNLAETITTDYTIGKNRFPSPKMK